MFRISMISAVLASVAVGDELATSVRDAVSRVSGHPRLFLSADTVAKLPAISNADAINTGITVDLLDHAESMLGEPPVIRELQGRRMLHVSRLALDRIVTLSLAWHLRGDPRHRDRAIAEMRAIAAFDDWHPAHFLDTAEMTLAASIGYDWLHASLDEETREVMRTAIFEKGLTPALASDSHWWMRTTNNWNQVCHGGMVAGALVLLESHPDGARHIIENAVRHLPISMASYAPAGAYPEGPSYWSYGTNYNVILLEMLESALGNTFGLEDAEGFDRTGSIPMLMTGPSGMMFNYSDGHADRHPQAAVYWLAKRFGHPAWAAEEDRLMAGAGRHSWITGLGMLWRDAEAESSTAAAFPTHWTSRSEMPVSIHRESWKNPDATFFGIKAGPPSASHGQMDAGSFVLDAGGIRWAHDLGMENYHHVESQGLRLWHKHQEADRWKVLRNNNLGHNTWVIDGELQRAAGDAAIIRFSDDDAFPHSVVDLSSAYGSQVETAYRGMALLPGGAVLVRDHLAGLRPGAEVRWGMATRAVPVLSDGSTLLLREQGAELEISIHGETTALWQVIDISKPTEAWNSPNPGMAMVTFSATAPASGVLDFAVVLRPGGREAPELTTLHLGLPVDWSKGP